jgi:hypothetical protein
MIEVKKFFWLRAGDDAAIFEQYDAGSEEQRFAQIVSDEDDGLAEAAGEGAEFALKLGARDGIKGAEGLVHEQDGRIGCKGACDADALTLAAGEFAGAPMSEFARIEADELEHFLDAGGGARGIPAFEAGDEANVFCNGEMGEEAGVLNDVPDTAAQTNGIPGGGRAIVDEDFSFRGQQHPVHQLEESGLAAATAAKENEGLTLRNFERDAGND